MPRDHKVHIYLEFHSVCLLARIETLPLPLPQASVPPLPEPKGEMDTLAWGWGGGGGPNSDDWRKSLVLCVFCGSDTFIHNNT